MDFRRHCANSMIEFLMRRGAQPMAERKTVPVTNAHVTGFVWCAGGAIGQHPAKGDDAAALCLSTGVDTNPVTGGFRLRRANLSGEIAVRATMGLCRCGF